MIQDKVKTLRTAKERTDKILFNVLPKEIASELNEKGNVMPKGFDEVSILFTDFKNFTNASSTMSPKKLVGDLNFIFHLFDEIIEQQGVEKIKTIGDKWSTFQAINFSSASQPYYVLLNPEGEIINSPIQYTDSETYYGWLKEGLEKFKTDQKK